MTSTDVATTAPSTPATKPDKPKRIPARIRQAIHLIATGEVTTQKAAAERVGVTPQHLCKMLARDNIRVFMTREASKTIAGASLRAASRMVGLIDAKSEHVSAQVSERILTSEGILKSDQRAIAVNVDVRAGFVLDLREEAAPLLPQQPRNGANPLIEHEARSSSPAPDDE